MSYESTKHKGFFGVDYRSKIGLHRTSTASDGAYIVTGTDPLWDFYVGALPFMVQNGDDNPYMRETTPVRRERLDQSREPGENSLDASLWLRSQTSWHLGAGQAYAEPLEETPDVARFRYSESGGINPWTPGQISLLPATTQRDTGARHCVGISGWGVLTSTNTAGVRLYPTSGSSVQLSTKTVTQLAANSTRWFALSTSGIEYGNLSTGGEGATALSSASAIHWGKDRLWVAAAATMYEITTMPPATLPAAFHTFRSGTVVDIDSGSSGIYVMLNDVFTSIYVITANDDGTLNPPREVGSLPRGETGTFLYGYLGRYLIIGTNKGIRVADCGSSTELPIGPLTVELAGGCQDAVGDGNFIWFTGGTTGVKVLPDTTAVPGLYRLDLSRPIVSVSAYGDTAAARYAYSTDIYCATTGQAYSVTTYNDQIFFVAGTSSANSPLWQQSASLVSSGWLETGKIAFSTPENKTWLSFNLDIDGDGSFYVTASNGGIFEEITQTTVAVPYSGDVDVDSAAISSSAWFVYRLLLSGDGTTAGSPTAYSIGLRSTPSPRRTRYIRIPLACADMNTDRNGNKVGYEGFAYDRVKDLEALEESGGIITVIDNRTGESIRCQIDKVNFSGATPPSRNYKNFGGVLILTLLSV